MDRDFIPVFDTLVREIRKSQTKAEQRVNKIIDKHVVKYYDGDREWYQDSADDDADAMFGFEDALKLLRAFADEMNTTSDRVEVRTRHLKRARKPSKHWMVERTLYKSGSPMVDELDP